MTEDEGRAAAAFIAADSYLDYDTNSFTINCYLNGSKSPKSNLPSMFAHIDFNLDIILLVRQQEQGGNGLS